MIERSPALWPGTSLTIVPAPLRNAPGEDRIVPFARSDRQTPAAPVAPIIPVAAASLPAPRPRDLDFTAVVRPVTLAMLTALLRSGSLQRSDRPYRGAIASRSWPS